MHRWMASAAGGTSQRLKPGLATVRSLDSSPTPFAPAPGSTVAASVTVRSPSLKLLGMTLLAVPDSRATREPTRPRPMNAICCGKHIETRVTTSKLVNPCAPGFVSTAFNAEPHGAHCRPADCLHPLPCSSIQATIRVPLADWVLLFSPFRGEPGPT